MTTPRAECIAGMRSVLPIMLGAVPFGLIYGVLAIGAGIPPLAAQAMSAIVFAGSAQFVMAQLVGAGVPGIVIFVTGTVINVRHALYSASLAPYLTHLRSAWKWLLAYLLTDEAYAVAITRYNHPSPITHKHWYFLGAGFALWLSWQISTAVGVFLGAQIPASWSLDFSLALTFIALVVPALQDRATSIAAATAGVVSVVAMALPYKLGLVTAMLLGVVIGVLYEYITSGAVREDTRPLEEDAR